jgi:hypothetical protein
VTLRSPSVLVAATVSLSLGLGESAHAPPSPPPAFSATPRDADDAGGGRPGEASTATGPIIDRGQPPQGASDRRACPQVCSFRHPLCVRGAASTAPSFALAALDAADRAWDTLIGTLGAPAPDGGLDGIWQVYLVDSVEEGGLALLAARDPLSRFDRAASFALVDRGVPEGCLLDFALARAVARGSLWRAAPATDEGSARAEVETLARLATPCASSGDDRRAFQAHPEQPIVGGGQARFDRGASLFFGWLDTTFGSAPASLLLGLWALAPTRTVERSSFWAGAPTGFDVLRVSLANALWKGSKLDDVFAKFAVARASADPPARVAWHIPWPARARRLASTDPVAPTGASYVLVDRDGAAGESKLRLEAEWEDYGRMRWVAVKFDASGKATAELPVVSTDRATRASLTIDSLDGVARVLIVGANVGSTEHPFDPDQNEWEPHGWLLTLEGQ